MKSRKTWLHRQVLLGIILQGSVIVIAAQPKGRRVSGEDTDAQANLDLVVMSYRYIENPSSKK